MLHARKVLPLTALTVICLATTCKAQQTLARTFADGAETTSAANQAAFTLSKQVNEVNLVFTVTDSKGHLQNKLARQDFQLFDNRHAVDQISYFHQETVLPLRVGVLIDVSSSIADRFGSEQKAAGLFLRKVLRKGIDEGFVLAFDKQVHLIEDWTGDPHSLLASVRHLTNSGGETALYDAMVFASAKLQARSGDRVTRQVIILITDGVDTASKAIMYDAQQAAARAEAVVYPLSTNDVRHSEYTKGEAVLDLLSSNAGGQVLPAYDKDQLARAFNRIEASIRAQYALGYVPHDLKADGAYHAVDILPRKTGLLVHGRKGYYAPHREQ